MRLLYRKRKFKKIFDKGCSLNYLRDHYLRMAKKNYHKYMDSGLTHSCKIILYVLRTIACAEYIRKENKLPPLPYKEVIYHLPLKIREFFERCVIKKNSTENSKISSDEKVSEYIESFVHKNIPKKNKNNHSIIFFMLKFIFYLYFYFFFYFFRHKIQCS